MVSLITSCILVLLFPYTCFKRANSNYFFSEFVIIRILDVLFVFVNIFKCSVAFGSNHALRKTHLRYSVAKFSQTQLQKRGSP